MTGGIVQLVAYGKEDLFLTRDPQITFFKVVYRRHTNFSREEVYQYFINDPDFGKRTTCNIAPEGDLINRMTLKITLPRIPKLTSSSSTSTTNGLDSTMTQFAWIKRIGFAMIKYVEVEINGRVIDRHFGEWLHIWSILTTKNIKDKGLDKLIGNVPELTDFSDTKDEYTLYIPLQFWFCRASGLSLPVMALQYSDIKINLELFDLDKCYILNPTHYVKCDGNLDNFAPYEYLIQKGLDNVERYGIFSHFDVVTKRLYYTAISPDKFIGVPYDGDITLVDDATKNALLATQRAEKYVIKGVSTDFTIKPDLGIKSITTRSKSLKNVKLKECVLLVDYVYLDDDERFKFAQTKHDYLIEQLYFTPNFAIEGTNAKIKLDIDQPCKLTVWVAQLDYINDFNDRFNYTDSHIYKRAYDVNQSDVTKFKLYNSIDIDQTVGNSLIDEENIKLNSQDRLTTRHNEYFEYLQPTQHTANKLPTGSGMYSYSLFPTEVYPSGTTNMSQIEFIELSIKMNYRVNISQKAKFRSYSLCNNIWRIDTGLSAPIFIR